MMLFLILFSMILLIPLTLFLLNFFFEKKSFQKMEKLSPYECGFSPFFHLNYMFSLNFFLICILFLIFDLEIILILPSIYSLFLMNFSWWMKSILFLFSILTFGLLIEFYEGALSWKF
uniref:NADH dehydrogenase subunit 3 n=1 Tax=Sirex nitobei TaxID=1602346 RepID=UPI0023D81886|nr:NADH dehydrogenase subunit 3 [Sirex nitobei]WDR47214.1 NADH dehydrogenase subunit 3 [Sirex nitobei]